MAPTSTPEGKANKPRNMLISLCPGGYPAVIGCPCWVWWSVPMGCFCNWVVRKKYYLVLMPLVISHYQIQPIRKHTIMAYDMRAHKINKLINSSNLVIFMKLLDGVLRSSFYRKRTVHLKLMIRKYLNIDLSETPYSSSLGKWFNWNERFPSMLFFSSISATSIHGWATTDCGAKLAAGVFFLWWKRRQQRRWRRRPS